MSRPEPIRPRPRGAKMAEIHINAKALGMDPADADPSSPYRSLLRTLTGVTSCKQLTGAGLDLVVDHLRKLMVAHGLQPKHHAKHPQRPKAPPLDKAALMGKIEAHLADAQRPWAYAHGMAKRMHKLDRLEFCHEGQLQDIVAALEYDQRRRAKRLAAAGAASDAPAGRPAGPVGADRIAEAV